MAIAIRASGSVTYDVNGTSQVVTKPAAAAAGDVAILVVSWATGGAGGATHATPTGWTVIGANVGNATANQEQTSAYYRVIQGGDTTWTVATSFSTQFGVVFQAFTGVDTATPIDATGTTSNNTGSATLSANAVTTVTNNAWHAIGAGTWNNAVMSATSFTALNNGSPSTNEQVCLLYNTTPKTPAGSTGAVTVNGGTASGNSMSAIPFALRPAATAAARTVGPFPSIPPALLTM